MQTRFQSRNGEDLLPGQMGKQHFHVANSAPTNPDELRRTPANSIPGLSQNFDFHFSWLVLTYHKATRSAWMPKFLPSCYQQGRGQGHTLCSRNPLFPRNHVAREKSHLIMYSFQPHTPTTLLMYLWVNFFPKLSMSLTCPSISLGSIRKWMGLSWFI